jgi:hypothetical protein
MMAVGCTHDWPCKSFLASGEAWRCGERLWPSSRDAHGAWHCRAPPDKWCVRPFRPFRPYYLTNLAESDTMFFA